MLCSKSSFCSLPGGIDINDKRIVKRMSKENLFQKEVKFKVGRWKKFLWG
ncbi:MAG: hypothetical protein ACI9JY_001791 [Saprospiraceae bacterium]|jgi:hypothetical protein